MVGRVTVSNITLILLAVLAPSLPEKITDSIHGIRSTLWAISARRSHELDVEMAKMRTAIPGIPMDFTCVITNM